LGIEQGIIYVYKKNDFVGDKETWINILGRFKSNFLQLSLEELEEVMGRPLKSIDTETS
jgi:hypothetical protein